MQNILRNYQHEAIENIHDLWRENKRKVMYQLPTGGGKTTVFSYIAQKANELGIPVLAVVHRIELIKQIHDRFMQFGLTPSVIASGIKSDYTNKVQIASIQTLNRRNFPQAGIVIIDEAHHAKANSYKSLFLNYPDAFFLGVTATPIRLDGLGFEMIDKHTPMFDSLVKSPQTNWFVENRYLAPADQYCGKVINLDTIPVKQGEYDNDMLMAKRHEMTDLLDSYFKYAMGKKTIVFAINVKHSKEIAQRYQNAGISAVHVDGTTPDREREAIMRKFKSGEIKVLCNVDIVSEGFDVPDCEVVQMARPVRSLSLYLQQGGRALRPSENKRAIILDNACNYLRHGHITADREWDLEGDYEIVQGKKKKRKKKPEDDEFKVAKELPTEVMGGMVLINPKQDAVEHEKRLFEAKLSEIITIQEARSYKPLSIFFKAKELGIIKTPEQFDYIKNVVSLKGYQEVGGFWHWRKKEMFAVSNNLPKNSYIAV